MVVTAKTAVATIKAVQAAFQVLASLHMTSHLMPQQANVCDGAVYDYVIVGAGTAGSVIANRLTEDDAISVLIIDDGNDIPLESNIPSMMLYLKESSSTWNLSPDYEIINSHRGPYNSLTQGKGVGGTSGTNFLIYSEGNQRDYDEWANIVNDSTWSDDVLPYLKKSQRLTDPIIKESADNVFFGKDGNIGLSVYRSNTTETFINALKEMGHTYVPSFNLNGTIGCTEGMFNVYDKTRQSTAMSYITIIKDRPNLHVLKNTRVAKINFDANNNAESVEADISDSKYITIYARKEVIVSAGVFNSAKLLLLSGVGPLKHLKSQNITTVSDLPVGENLHSQTATFVVYNMTKNICPYEYWNPYSYPAALIEVSAAVNKANNIPDYRALNFVNQPEDLMNFCSFTYNFNADICNSLLGSENNSQMMFSLIAMQNIKTRGHVLLKSNNHKTPPFIYLNNCPKDLDLSAAIIQDFVKIGETEQFKALGAEIKDPLLKECDKMDIHSEKYWKCYMKALSFPLYNFVGTCAMGSVVDSRLRVKGVQRLRVADASVIPTFTDPNIMGPIVMIAEKVSDMIKEDNTC